MNNTVQCLVCLGVNSTTEVVKAGGGGYKGNCPVCGRYALSEEAWEDFLDPRSDAGRKLSQLDRARLSHRVRVSYTDGSSKSVKLTQEFLESFIKDGCPGPRPAEQATNIIRYIGDEVSRSGKMISNIPVDFHVIVGAPNRETADRLVEELRKLEILSSGKDDRGRPNLSDVGLTLDGWERYEAEKRGKLAGKHGFIAMKFGDTNLESFVGDVVKPAVKNGIGYDLIDMRDVPRAGIIDNIMRTQIRDAAFVIVDLTHDNSGAYWEAGYAEGLGKPVIYICEKTKFEEKNTHFDTNHCTTVRWLRERSQEKDDDFSQELVATLRRSLNLFSGAP